MSNAPERIWVDADIYGYYSDVEYNPCSYEPGFDRVEYVRADLYEELCGLLHEVSQMMVADVVGYAERNTINNWVTRANDRNNT